MTRKVTRSRRGGEGSFRASYLLLIRNWLNDQSLRIEISRHTNKRELRLRELNCGGVCIRCYTDGEQEKYFPIPFRSKASQSSTPSSAGSVEAVLTKRRRCDDDEGNDDEDTSIKEGRREEKGVEDCDKNENGNDKNDKQEMLPVDRILQNRAITLYLEKYPEESSDEIVRALWLWLPSKILTDEVMRLLKDNEAYNKPTANILELGAGAGVVGIFISKVFKGACVYITDRSKAALQVATLNAALNCDGVGLRRQNARSSAQPSATPPAPCAGFKLIMASDVCYDDDCVVPLWNTINRAHELRFTQTIENGKVIREEEDSTLKLFIQACFDTCNCSAFVKFFPHHILCITQKGTELGFFLRSARAHRFRGCGYDDRDNFQYGDEHDARSQLMNEEPSYNSIFKIKAEAPNSAGNHHDDSKGHIVTLVFKRSCRTTATRANSENKKTVSKQNNGAAKATAGTAAPASAAAGKCIDSADYNGDGGDGGNGDSSPAELLATKPTSRKRKNRVQS
eukprot:jgi/Bigna1/83656/fgenesh1_pg.112_\